MTDEEIVAMFRGPDGHGPDPRGEARAWTEFLQHFDQRIRTTCAVVARRSGLPIEEAEDAVQDVYLKLSRDRFAALRRFQPRTARLSTWVSRVASNACIDRVRRRRPGSLVSGSTGSDEDGVLFDPPDTKTFDLPSLLGQDQEAEQTIAALAECINGLKDKRRLFVLTKLLCHLAWDGKPTTTLVGSLHGASPQLAKYHLDKAMDALRECVEDRPEEPGGGEI